jgi:hypothetical protein
LGLNNQPGGHQVFAIRIHRSCFNSHLHLLALR